MSQETELKSFQLPAVPPRGTAHLGSSCALTCGKERAEARLAGRGQGRGGRRVGRMQCLPNGDDSSPWVGCPVIYPGVARRRKPRACLPRRPGSLDGLRLGALF